MPGPKKTSAKPAGLAGLATLRSQLPAGPEVRHWLVATGPSGEPGGWIAVTRYRQTIGRQPGADLRLPETCVTATVIEADDGRAMLEIVAFSLTVATKDGGREEETTGGATVHVGGRKVTRIGTTLEIGPDTELTIWGGRTHYRLRLVNQRPETPAKIAAPEALPPDPRDIILRGQRRNIDGDLHAGWIEISDGGVLACTGTLSCLAVILEDGGTLQCAELVTNVLSVDNQGRGATIEAAKIRARVVHRVQLALAALIERGSLEADYIQHHGGDLNPSWDDATGTMVLLPELYAHGRDPEGPVVLFDAEIRARLRAGENIFTTGDLLVR